MLMTSTTETIFLTSKLLKQGYRYHKILKLFSKFYYRHSELIVKYNIFKKNSFATKHIRTCIYGDFAYNFKKNCWKA